MDSKKINLRQYLPLLFQITRFGLVGVTAAIIHFSIVVFLVEVYLLQPLIANIIAFCIAFQFSYWGHRKITFYGSLQKHSVAMRRLLIVSIGAFAINESLFYLLMSQFYLSYPVALFIVLTILPGIVFTINKMWVFE